MDGTVPSFLPTARWSDVRKNVLTALTRVPLVEEETALLYKRVRVADRCLRFLTESVADETSY